MAGSRTAAEGGVVDPRLVFCPARDREAIQSVTEGTVIIIGGAEDKVRDRVILTRFVSLAGGADARIMVISTASSLGAEAGERYRGIFRDLNVASILTLHAVSRSQANDEKSAMVARDATGIFLT